MSYKTPKQIIRQTLALVDEAKEKVKDRAVIVSVVMAGYFISLAVQFAKAFLEQALLCLDQGRKDINEYTGEETVQHANLGRYRKVIYSTLAQLERLEQMHEEAGLWYESMGFEPAGLWYKLFGVIRR